MRKKIISLVIIIFIFTFIYLIFNSSNIINNTIIFSCNVFIKNIFPSLFPMFIISSMLISIGIPKFLSNIFNKLFYKLFKSNHYSSFIFFMSMITGAPSNAKYINDLNLNNNDSEKILLFTYFSNPLFIINTVGNIFLNNKLIGMYMLISHIISNIIIGIIFRNYNICVKINKEDISLKDNLKLLNNNINNSNIFSVLFYSIKSAIDILLSIFGIITFFLIFINILGLNKLNIFSIFISGILEMTTGLKLLSLSNLNYNFKIYLSMFFISFGGLSIHAQIFNILNKKKVKYLPFLMARLLHGLISIVIIFLLRVLF